MYLLHYLLPFGIFYFFRDKIMLFGLLLGSLIDLDHIFLRIEGIVPWLGNICNAKNFWNCDGFFGYPLHSPYMIISLIIVSAILFALMNKEKGWKVTSWMFWICMGALLNLLLDFVQLLTGVGFVVKG